MIINVTNGIIAAGRATRDAEFKFVGAKGTHLCKFSIVGIDATPEKPTTYVNVVAWFDLADYAQCIAKGDRVLVAGTFKNADYTNNQGEVVKRNELVADFIQIQQLGSEKMILPPASPLEILPDAIGSDDELPF